jgi:quercetin dioxygenase-like cupin family protein
MMTVAATRPACSEVLPDGGERIRIFDEEFVVKVTGPQTSGGYALLQGTVAPGGGPPLHAHPGPETFYVVSGEFEFTQRDDRGVSTSRGGPGTVFHAPERAPHRFENVSSTRSAMLIVASADTVDFLRELGAAFPPGAAPSLETVLAIHEKYAIETFHGEAGSRPEPSEGDATSARARALAWQFEQANNALIAMIERCTSAQWRAICADTGWTVGVQAHHIATGEAAIAALIQDSADGRPHPPMPPGKLDAINSRHAAEFASVTVDETVTLLRRNGSAAARSYRYLSEAQLGLEVTVAEGGQPATLASLIDHLAIGEIARHGAEIRQALLAASNI